MGHRQAGWVAVVAAAVVGVWAPSAAADEAAMSRFHYERASADYARGRYESAVEHFIQAQRLSPNPRTVYNIGLCFLQLRRYPDAFHFLSEYLSQQDDAKGAEERRALAQESLDKIEPKVARVRVESDPPGADIYVDKEEYGVWGTTPRVLAVEPGERLVWAKLDGHHKAEKVIRARLGEEVAVVLEPERIVGWAWIKGVPGARARIIHPSGRVADEGELPFKARLPPGRYDMEVSAEGYREHRQLVAVFAGETSEVEVSMDRLPPPKGSLAITADVPQAVVEIDGEPAGFTPLPVAELSTDPKQVKVTAPGHLPWEGEVQVHANEQNWVRVSLAERPQGRSPLTWVFGGVGLGLLAAGGITGGYALAQHDDFQDVRGTLSAGDLRDERDRGRALNISTDVLLTLGVASLATGVILFFVTDDRGERESTATVSGGRE